jgi:GNAT superfamily N-acetyltransferase
MEPIQILDFSEELSKYFESLNREWIEQQFTVLPSDQMVFMNPSGIIIKKGGCIFFAQSGEAVVGTVAMLKVNNNTYEVAKMAVTKSFRRRGIGKSLLNRVIEEARKRGASSLILYTNDLLKEAILMYSQFGFKQVPKTEFHNERATIKMELLL